MRKNYKQCSGCGQIYPKKRKCDMEYIEIKGVRCQRVRYGSSTEGLGPAISRCPDCGVMPGYCHHWLCTYEMCPVCGQQLLNCACNARPVLV